MPVPSTGGFALTEPRFLAEFALLQQQEPLLAAGLVQELQALTGKPWPLVVAATKYRFVEDRFDGQVTIATMEFCGGKVVVVVHCDQDAVVPVTFWKPSFHGQLGDRD